MLAGDSRVVEAPLRRLPRGGYTVRWATISNDSHVGRGVFTFGVRVAAPPIAEAYGASGPGTSEHVVRWLYFICLALLTGGLGFRLLVLRGEATPGGRAALLPRRRRGRDRSAVGRDARLPAPRRGRAPVAVHRVPVRRPLAVRARHALRPGVRRDGARLRGRRRAALPRLADRAPMAALAGLPALARSRLGALALEPPVGRPRLAAFVRRLGAPVRGDALDRRAALARARRLERPRAPPDGVLAVLGDRRAARRARRRRRRLHDVQALPGARRPLVGRLRASCCSSSSRSSAWRSPGARSTTSSSGRGWSSRSSPAGCRGASPARRRSRSRSCCWRRSSSTRSRLRSRLPLRRRLWPRRR